MFAQRQKTNQHGKSDCKTQMRSIPGTEAWARPSALNPLHSPRPLTFAAAKMGAEAIPGLLESIRKATSERRETA